MVLWMTFLSPQFSIFLKISIVPFITIRKILINKLKKGENALMVEVVTLLIGQDIWLPNMLFANSQKVYTVVKYCRTRASLMWHSVFPSKGKAPSPFTGVLGLENITCIFEAALIWDPSHQGSWERTIWRRLGGSEITLGSFHQKMWILTIFAQVIEHKHMRHLERFGLGFKCFDEIRTWSLSLIRWKLHAWMLRIMFSLH